jgi:hypothetical protein
MASLALTGSERSAFNDSSEVANRPEWTDLRSVRDIATDQKVTAVEPGPPALAARLEPLSD